MTPFDLHLFHEGTHQRLYEKLGARPLSRQGTGGAWFAIWAPGARAVSVIGSFNQWDREAHRLRPSGEGVWEIFVPGVHDGALYKFFVEFEHHSEERPDPMAFAVEPAPGNASVLAHDAYEWHDALWMSHKRRAGGSLEAPVAICAGAAHEALELGFTHAALPPVTGFAAPADPQAFKAAVDHLHQHGLGAVSELRPAPGFEGREAQSASLSAAVWWTEKYHLDLLIGRDLVADRLWADELRQYLALDADRRAGHHGLLTSRMSRAFSANFVLPWLHPTAADDWQSRSTERLALALAYALPGKKLVSPPPSDTSRALLVHMNQIYRAHPELHQADHWHEGFAWIDSTDAERSIVSFVRRNRSGSESLVFIANFRPIPYERYQLGVPVAGYWEEIANTDGAEYGGRGYCNGGRLPAAGCPLQGQPYSITVTVPPLGGVFFRLVR